VEELVQVGGGAWVLLGLRRLAAAAAGGGGGAV